jgi:uncharacterized membrane protein YhaH (DUF805 family)
MNIVVTTVLAVFAVCILYNGLQGLSANRWITIGIPVVALIVVLVPALRVLVSRWKGAE